MRSPWASGTPVILLASLRLAVEPGLSVISVVAPSPPLFNPYGPNFMRSPSTVNCPLAPRNRTSRSRPMPPRCNPGPPESQRSA
jgi:hypothetical protein